MPDAEDRDPNPTSATLRGIDSAQTLIFANADGEQESRTLDMLGLGMDPWFLVEVDADQMAADPDSENLYLTIRCGGGQGDLSSDSWHEILVAVGETLRANAAAIPGGYRKMALTIDCSEDETDA